MFEKSLSLKKYLASILNKKNKLDLIYDELVKKDFVHKNEEFSYKLKNYKKLIYKYQNNIKNKYNIKTDTRLIKNRRCKLSKIVNIINNFKKYNNMDIIVDNKKNINKSVDLYYNDNYLKKKKNKFIFLAQNNKIKNSLLKYDKEKLFQEIIFFFFNIYNNLRKNKFNENFIRRKSLNKVKNIKEIKLYSLHFEEFLYNLVIKQQIKNKVRNKMTFNKIYIPNFLKYIKNNNNSKNKEKTSNTLINTTKNKIKKLALRINKIYKNSITDLNLNQEIFIYNILVNYLKNYYKIEDKMLENKNYEKVKKSIIDSKLIDEYKKEENNNKNCKKKKRFTSKRFVRIDILYQQAKIDKDKKFKKILKNSNSNNNLLPIPQPGFRFLKNIKKTYNFNSVSNKTNISKFERMYSIKRDNNYKNFINNNNVKSNIDLNVKSNKAHLKKVILREFLRKNKKIIINSNPRHLDNLYNLN